MKTMMMGSQGPLSDGVAPSVSITFPAAVPFALTRPNSRRAFLGSNYSRAAFGLQQGALQGVVDFDHEGQGANAVTWLARFAGYTRGQCSLTAGTRTGAQVATQAVTALEALGFSGVTRVDATVTVANSHSLVIGAAMDPSESLRGMWGAQRWDFGPADLSSAANMGATIAMHIVAPASAGRILGVYSLNTTGAAAIRLGIADGPAWAENPSAFSAGVEGLSAIGTDGLRVLMFAEPIAMTASQSKWILARGAGGGNPTVGYRLHSASPTGQGDLTTNERLLSSLVSADPDVEIFTAGAYTHNPDDPPAGGEDGFQVYSQHGFIYEIAVAGEYPADGGLETRWGYHGTYDGGTPTQAAPGDLDGLSETFRHTMPWAATPVDFRIALFDNAADEDGGGALYDWTGESTSLAPIVGVPPLSTFPPLIHEIGPFGCSAGGGYKTVTLVAAPAFDALDILALSMWWGNDDGVTAADTISTNYDPPGAAGAYLSGWVDNGREWCDMVDSGPGARGIDAQYLTDFLGDMPFGDPSAAAPDPFDAAVTDTTPDNHFRHAIRVRRAGMVAA